MYQKKHRTASFAAALTFALVASTFLAEASFAAKARISGTPRTSVDAGDYYRFKPSVSGFRESKLKFSIKRKPSWATFVPSTGALKGTPTENDVGRYARISITATDGNKSATLDSFTVRVNSSGGGGSGGSDDDDGGSGSGGGSGGGGSGGGGSGGGSGTADTTIAVGEAYASEAQVRNLNTKKVSFKIRNKPSWMWFTRSGGRLKGTPEASDVGFYDNILIIADDGRNQERFGPFSLEVVGSGGGGSGGGGGGGGGGGNTAPVISGSPPSSVLQDTAYSFTPSASDADGDSLTFSVSGLPSWASFRRSDGRISGRPGSSDIGIHGNIVITVSDGTAESRLGPFDILVDQAGTGSVTLQWSPPTRNTDGSRLRDLAGYRIDWGLSNRGFTNSVTVNNAGLSSYVVEDLPTGNYMFAIAAINSSGVASGRSNTARRTVN